MPSLTLQTTASPQTRFFAAHDHCANVDQATGHGQTSFDAKHNHIVRLAPGQDGRPVATALAMDTSGRALDHTHIVQPVACTRPGGCGCGG